ncbi:MAG TPA: hypothetical protein VF069_13185 [Streptosporangiaceae bacterium]
MHPLARGLLAGAAGTVALNVSTYADMLVRGRGSSGVPAEVADRLADRAGITLGAPEQKSNREQAAGAMMGFVTGLGTGAAYGMISGRGGSPPAWLAGPLLGAIAMAGSDGPAAALGVADPRQWSRTAWLSDIVPHMVYGMVTAVAYRAMR